MPQLFGPAGSGRPTYSMEFGTFFFSCGPKPDPGAAESFCSGEMLSKMFVKRWTVEAQLNLETVSSCRLHGIDASRLASRKRKTRRSVRVDV